MPPLDFPASPSVGQTHPGPGGVVWQYDGQKWANGATGVGAGVSSFNTRTGAVTLASGDVTTALTYTPYSNANPSGYQTAAQVTTAVAPALANTGRNLIHNGLFNVAQRGAGPFLASNAWQYGLDRWRLLKGNAAETFTQFQAPAVDGDRSAIGDEEARVSLNNAFTGSAAAGSYCLTEQPIERVHRLAGKAVVLSFWAKASAALKLGASWDQFFGDGGSPSAIVSSAVQSVNLTTVWARYSMSFTLPSVAGKTLGSAGNDATFLNFWLSSALAGGIGAQSGQIWIWGVQLEIGTVATPLEKRTPAEELAEASRYYSTGYFNLSGYAPAGGVGWLISQSLPVAMRATPTMATVGATAINVTGQTVASATPVSFYVSAPPVATGGFAYYGTWTASADL